MPKIGLSAFMKTGAWTESPAFYLQMIGNEMTLDPIVS
jgi:hypothetical protein